MHDKTATLPSEDVAPMGPLLLRVASGPDKGKSALLAEGTAVIGTRSDCELMLTDPSVSRRHASVELRGARLRVRDLESKNGTRYLGALIERVDVPFGASIRLGETEVVLVSPPTKVRASTERSHLHGLVGASPKMQELYAQIEQAAASELPVIVHGETGVGKEEVARSIHLSSARASGPFSVFDCGAVQGERAQVALFGHMRGAFTGAHRNTTGLLAQADGGTLFLDDVAALSLEQQPALLRALETGTYVPLGGTEPIRSSFRVVAAASSDLEQVVAAGAFREDLYYRLSGLVVRVPPLRERLDDIALLAGHFAGQAGGSLRLTPSTLARLFAHRWPGNVRELRNVIKRALALGTDAVPAQADEVVPESSAADYHQAREQAIKAFEKSYLLWLLDRHQGSRSAAARDAGVARSYFYRLLEAHGLAKHR